MRVAAGGPWACVLQTHGRQRSHGRSRGIGADRDIAHRHLDIRNGATTRNLAPAFAMIHTSAFYPGVASRLVRDPSLRPPRRADLADLPVRIGRLTWAEWARATIYTVIVLAMVLAAVVIIYMAGGHVAAGLVGLLEDL